MRAQFITASEVAEIMGISRSKAYQIVREMNRELKSQGYLTVAGKCPAQYFKQKFYGFQIPGGERNDGNENDRPHPICWRRWSGSRLTIHLTRAYHMKPAKAIPEENIEEMRERIRRMNDPRYLHTVSMTELYQTVYKSRPPVIDGLLLPGHISSQEHPKSENRFW